MNEPSDPDAEISAPKKRTRVQFSCTACRYRKLKCCRNHPCNNCKKRGEATSCTYVGRGPRAKAQHGRSSPTLVQDRLHHLENLVMSLAQKQRSDLNVDFNSVQSGDRDAGAMRSLDAALTPVDTGTLVVKNEGTSYIDSANWRAILEEINDVKECIGENSNDEGVDIDPYDASSPVLLLGNSRPVSKEEMLMDIPPRSIADRLVSRFLKTSEPARVVIHVPTYQKEYEEFWLHPADKSFTWISLLYSIMALSVSLHHRGSEQSPSTMEDSINSWAIFRKRSSQCLIQANYITPGRYKGEALLLYSLTEFYRTQDAQIGMSYLLGITIRLAMRMGYHRDPRHYPMLSAMDGEMRRRLWALLVQLDTIVSFQVGVPRTIQPWQYDTELPSNLWDTDFDESSVQLPPGRPDNEGTDCSYMRAKSHVMSVFGQITDLAFSQERSSYDEILEIDRRLETAHDMIPSFLKVRPMTQCIADPAELTTRRFALELLYQIARLVLHRRYIAETNTKFAYSRSVCLAAARQVLQYNTEIWSEFMPGGQLFAARYFLNSLQNSFILSAMILCLEMSQDADRGHASRLEPRERAEFLLLLESTHRIFMETRHRSVDTQRAVNALTIMLKRVKKGDSQSSSSTAGQSMAPMDNYILTQSTSASVLDQQYSTYTSNISELQSAIPNPGQTSYNSLGVIEDMLDIPAQLDWNLYDSHISAVEMATNNDIWYSGGPAIPYDFGAYPPGSSSIDHESYQ
ncbi:transcriptional regulator family: Fungal Specific TF [Penicillium roqueforti]|nr:transcriptional regulator family: Fungal Specific TF [Penicillium roqueforti]KAI3181326.1 transcriptional regulator family: Fungal Specific TF [Penicillium roqueforti]KAI3196251.1 transcriptional regulator family: Fungal Specific TF [Penicillium roqueforti]